MNRCTDSDDASPLRRLKHMLRMTSATANESNSQMQPSSVLQETTEDSNIPDETSENIDLPYPLTREEAITFVETKLNMPDCEAFFRDDPLQFLNRVAERMNQVVPFTNMHFFTSKSVWADTGEDCKNRILSGEGGTCTWINPFTRALVEKLGYNAHHVWGNNPGDGRKDTHISTIVCDVSYPGSRHLIDPGTRRPLCAAIPLDFEKESPVYKFHYMRSKFFWKEDNVLVWCAKSSQKVPESYIMYDSNNERWNIQVTYWLKTRPTWYQHLSFWRNFGQISPLTFKPPFNGLVFFAYLNDKIVSILAFREKVLTIIHDENSHKVVRMSRTELMNFFLNHYPQYPAKMLQEVFDACQLE